MTPNPTESFGQLLAAHRPLLESLVRRYARACDRDDAYQEVCLHLYLRWSRFDPARAKSIDGFVGVLARNRLIDFGRRRGWAQEEREASPVTATYTLDEQLEAWDASRVLRRFEHRLKPAFRPWFRAVVLEDGDEGSVGWGRARSSYVRSVVLAALKRHPPLREWLGRC